CANGPDPSGELPNPRRSTRSRRNDGDHSCHSRSHIRLSQIPSCTSTTAGPSPATSAYSATPNASGGDELAALGHNPLEQLAERVGELLDTLLLECHDDVVVVDTGLGDALEHLPGPVDVLLQRERHLAVVLEGADRLLGHRVHGLGPDQVLDVQHVP